nr:retrotransposon Gag protein [Tanacetum cinerariifolium]
MASGGNDRDAEYALSKLLQMGTVAEYQNEFVILINRVTGISESLLKSFYMSGLKPALQIEMFRAYPTTLREAFSLSHIIEARFEAIAEKEKERIIEKNADIILSLRSELASLEIKGSLDADKDIGVDEVSSAINSVFNIGESNMESMKVRSKLGEFSKNKESVKEAVVGGGEARGVDKNESNRVISVLKDDSLDEINMGLSEEFGIRVLGRDVSGKSLVVSLKLVCHKKSHKVLSVTSWSAEGRQRLLCYVQGNRRRRKKSVGVTKSSFANKDVAMGKEAKIQRRLWYPRIKSAFQDNNLRAMWF